MTIKNLRLFTVEFKKMMISRTRIHYLNNYQKKLVNVMQIIEANGASNEFKEWQASLIRYHEANVNAMINNQIKEISKNFEIILRPKKENVVLKCSQSSNTTLNY